MKPGETKLELASGVSSMCRNGRAQGPKQCSRSEKSQKYQCNPWEETEKNSTARPTQTTGVTFCYPGKGFATRREHSNRLKRSGGSHSQSLQVEVSAESTCTEQIRLTGH